MGNTQHEANTDEAEKDDAMSEEERFLYLCGKVGDDDAVREAVQTQPELVHCRDTLDYRLGDTPLHHAALGGHEAVARVLLEYGAEVNVQGKYDWSPLHYAAFNGRAEVARLLLAHGAEVSMRGAHGATPLHYAAVNNYEEVVRLLLDHNADRSVKNDKGDTPRDAAERREQRNVVMLLDTYVPVKSQLVQVLLGLRGASESPLLVKCLLTGEENAVFEQLQREAQG